MTRHVDTDVLASYREGDVSRRRAAWIRAHLAGCARCSGVNSDLAAVSSVLAGVQMPPMPEHLAMRIQGALATESAQRAAGSPGLAAAAPDAATDGAPTAIGVPGRPDLPERSRHSRRLRRPDMTSPLLRRRLAAAAAVVVLAGGGYLLASGSGSGSPAPSAEPAAGSETPHRAPVFGGPEINSGGRNPAATPESSAGQNQTFGLAYGAGGRFRTAAETSSVDFEPATLGARIRQQVANIPGDFYSLPSPAATGSHSTPSPAGPNAGAGGLNLARLAACVTLVAAGRDVLVVDIALYQSAPATIIVSETSPTAKSFAVIIVSRACSGTRADIIARVTVPAG